MKKKDLPVIEEDGRKFLYAGENPKGFREEAKAAGNMPAYMEEKGMGPPEKDYILIIDPT